MLKSRFLMKVMAVAAAATVAVTPATAFADDAIDIYAVDEEVHEERSDISVDGKDESAVEVRAIGSEVDITTGSLTSEDGPGYSVDVYDNSKVSGTVNGDIKAKYEGVGMGASAGTENDVTVNGDITTEEVGVYTFANDDMYTQEDKHGDSRNDVTVNGDITALEVGVVTFAYNGGENHVEVAGNISSSSGHSAINVAAVGDGSKNDVLVKGDVKGNARGVVAYVEGKGAENNVVIDGILSAKDAAVVAKEDVPESKNTVTVWKIETPGYTGATLKDDGTGDPELVESEKVAKSIQYIIKVTQNDNATLTATDADGNALATVTGAGGSVLEYAHEGDKVLLKVDVADGYQLDAAYGDEGQQLELVKDTSGNYYINVPRNGGVNFSVKLSKIEKKDSDKDKDDTNAQNPSYIMTDTQVVTLISSAAAGSAVTLSGMTGTGLSASVVAQLLARRDVAVTMTFMMNGMLYKITIPAGADIAKLVGADGSISFAALGQEFGMTPA